MVEGIYNTFVGSTSINVSSNQEEVKNNDDENLGEEEVTKLTTFINESKKHQSI